MDEARERASAERGRHARALLDDPLLIEAFATVEATLIEAWRNTPARDADGRERFYAHVKALAKVREALGEVASNGEVSAATLRGISGERQGIVARFTGR